MPSLPEATPMTQKETLPAERILVIGAAAVPHSTVTTKKVKEGPSGAQSIINTTVLMSTGIPLHLGGKTRVVEKTTTHTERTRFVSTLSCAIPGSAGASTPTILTTPV